MIVQIISFVKSRTIELQRSIDHTVSYLRGVPLGRFSKITPTLFLGGQPNDKGIPQLKKWEVTAIVSMRMKVPKKAYQDAGFTLLHLPTVDQMPPTIADLQKGVKFIEEVTNQGGKVYIHCRFGEGRGPSMAIAYLMSQGLTLEDAITQVKKVRTFINPSLKQMLQLKEFEKLVQADKKDVLI